MATSGVGLHDPATLSGMSVDTALLQKGWDTAKIYRESVQADPLLGNADFTEVIESDGGTVVSMPKNKLIIDVTPKSKVGKAARSIELVFLKSLSVAPVEGNASEVLGSETTLSLKRTSVQANDWGAGVSTQKFGIDYRELMMAYGIDKFVPDLLKQWRGELFSYYARQAMIERISHNLTAAPVSATAGVNPNFWFINGAVGTQPAYDSTLATYKTQIGAAATSLYGSTQRPTIPAIIELLRNARETRYLSPVEFNGKQLYFYLCPSPEFDYLRDPSQDNSFTRYWRDVGAITDIQKTMPSTPILSMGDECIIVRDPRYASMVVSGTSAAYTLTFGYLKYGRTSTRSSTAAAGYFRLGMFMGAGSLVKYEPEMPHDETQDDVYKKYQGNANMGAIGFNLPVWDLDDADITDATAQQESCMVIAHSIV